MKKSVKWLILAISLLLVFCIKNYSLYTSTHPRYLHKKISVNFPVKRNNPVEHVYIILVDGLRYDHFFKNMKYTRDLINENKACLFKGRFHGPSNSRPGYARIFTGCPTIENGIYSNSQQERCKITSVFEAVMRKGLTTGACAFYWVGQLFNRKVVKDRIYCDQNENIQYSYFYSSEEELDTEIFNNSMSIIKTYKPNLFLMHFMESDIAGHRFGGSSPQYSKCVETTDKLIEEFFSRINMDNCIVMIISDHGHKDRGGHGGNSSAEVEVPIILAGNIVEANFYDRIVYHEDIAPTICMLLDVPYTPYMKGNPLDFAFKVDFRYLNYKNKMLYNIMK